MVQSVLMEFKKLKRQKLTYVYWSLSSLLLQLINF